MQPFGPLSQYVCNKCGSILKETSEHIDISTLVEDCPNCGSYLADNLIKRNNRIELNYRLSGFQTAFDLASFKIDIKKISQIMPLSSTGSLCIAGYMSNMLLTRLMIRTLLPANYGGLDSPFVIVADAGNKSDFYQTVKFARMYGLDLKSTLDRIIISRAFTIYQLKSLLLRELPKVKQDYKTNVVIIPGLLDMFEDPNIKKKEAKMMIERVIELINDNSQRLLVIASIKGGKYDNLVLPKFDKKIVLSSMGNKQIKTDIYNKGKNASVILAEKELTTIDKM